MAERIAVQWETCGHPYSARRVGDKFVLPTNDGKCVCGSESFVEVEGVTDLADETAR